MLSRAKPATGPGATAPQKDKQKKKKVPKLDEFLAGRDFTGAITLLEVRNEGIF
jgi:intraflagellar transport protein 56